MAEMVGHLTEQEQKEWVRGYPYSAAFTQGVVHRLSLAAIQVACLEGEKAALGEALQMLWDHHGRRLDDAIPSTCNAAEFFERWPLTDAQMDRKVRAALSDDGEGWLEVREQARKALEFRAKQAHVACHKLAPKSSPHQGIFEKCKVDGCVEARAALDALGGK